MQAVRWYMVPSVLRHEVKEYNLGIDLDSAGGVLNVEKSGLAKRPEGHDPAAQGEGLPFPEEGLFVLFPVRFQHAGDLAGRAEVVGVERDARIEQELGLFLAVAQQLLLGRSAGLVLRQKKSPCCRMKRL